MRLQPPKPHLRPSLPDLLSEHPEMGQVSMSFFLQICRVPTGFAEAKVPPGSARVCTVMFYSPCFTSFMGSPPPEASEEVHSVSLSAPGPFQSRMWWLPLKSGDPSRQEEVGCRAFVFLRCSLKSKTKRTLAQYGRRTQGCAI